MNIHYFPNAPRITHGPFDILGVGLFFEKKFLAPILNEKKNLAQWHSEKKICLQ